MCLHRKKKSTMVTACWSMVVCCCWDTAVCWASGEKKSKKKTNHVSRAVFFMFNIKLDTHQVLQVPLQQREEISGHPQGGLSQLWITVH